MSGEKWSCVLKHADTADSYLLGIRPHDWERRKYSMTQFSSVNGTSNSAYTLGYYTIKYNEVHNNFSYLDFKYCVWLSE